MKEGVYADEEGECARRDTNVCVFADSWVSRTNSIRKADTGYEHLRELAMATGA